MSWLLETLLWTGALIGFVLLLRRPVSRWFGPQAAYALWLLPFLRLIMPGITLPAWMNPNPQVAAAPGADPVMVIASNPALMSAESIGTPVPAAATSIAMSLSDIVPFLLAIWLAGAVVFMVMRFRAYFDMRDALLADAREVGREGGVRLVETPATKTPLAFGVFDKVVALPPRFLALSDRSVRDLALAHELAHHRGGDLIVNFAVQPLFALHWFNPLGWVGWRALRRDQEAACDARVVGTADAEMRATYAHTIASFAAGPAFARGAALAAPMACPVLGDKSIIHRLRSLKMSDISTTRRWGGRALLLAGALALPLTASISYAETMREPPAPPAPPAAELPPAPPAPPRAPEAPAAPLAPTLDEEFDATMGGGEDGKKTRRIVIEREFDSDDGETVTVINRKGKDGKVKIVNRRVNTFAFFDEDGEGLSDEDREKLEKRLEKRLKDREIRWEELGERLSNRIELRYGKEFEGKVAKLAKLDCDKADGQARSITSRDGTFAFALCAEGIARDARQMAAEALEEARAAIREERSLTDAQRREALAGVEQAIRELNQAD
ncbi:M56 family metallopeptidase [Parerythrobacter jejuensis]|uniref:Peptidase M56 domain-containing protein n=1 Tax=Parerythrobacter jejuensis TaxID=795812 RepID=A0A845AT59_9SPHN|nr:M56 family metallopeptidase [Parerythrobacter jejuensis]MXP32547.1 hypothetical protein [Parerythrobacter jejuensis]